MSGSAWRGCYSTKEIGCSGAWLDPPIYLLFLDASIPFEPGVTCR